ncbi:ketopantoate reductase PanE/ApbA C terminal-domain-containing protein [Trametes polyzona]|nr:ketopantoate reductase PanE/ApbA C terminal-domain-containing protein [Trametes polyzona]
MSSAAVEDVCIIGFGAIGALYAFALGRSGKARVTAICRSNYDSLRERGLDIESDRFGTYSQWKPDRVVRTVEEAADRHYSYVICSFKCIPEIITTPALLGPLLSQLKPGGPTTTFVLLQNGIGIEDDLVAALAQIDSPTAVVSGCCWVDTTAIEGGTKIVQRSRERLVLGCHRIPNAREQVGEKALRAICELFKAGGSDVEAAVDIDIARWRKVLWNASFSTLCTLTRAHVGNVLALETSRNALKDIMREVLAVARATLTPSSAVDEVLADSVVDEIVDTENHASVFRPSMLVDLDCGRPMEVEAIVGGVLRRARAKNVPTPKLDLIYAGLSVIQSTLIKPKP